MENVFNASFWQSIFQTGSVWILENIFVFSTLIQLIVIGALYLFSWWISRHIKKLISAWNPQVETSRKSRVFFESNAKFINPGIWAFFLWIAVTLCEANQFPHHLLTIVSSLLLAWIVIQLVSHVVKIPLWRRTIAGVAWTIAALNILGGLESTIIFLDTLTVSVGAIQISAYKIIKSIITLFILLWLAVFISNIFERKIQSSQNFTPSFQVLSSKLFKILLMVFAVFIALSGTGIDFTAFAVFSGAIGVGVGFGLQKIVSNLISGVILLLDKSIKPGDVIAIPGYYGQVNSLGARYVSVLTRDGIEHLIPNEELIINRVENWSYSHSQIRLRLEIGIHYNSNVDHALELCLEAVRETKRALSDPKPVCLLREFGDSSVNLEIRFWINDPMNGRANVKSEILLKVWHKFHEHNIEIPYPQRDLHIRSSQISNPLEGIEKE